MKTELLYTTGGNVNYLQSLWKTAWGFLNKLKIGTSLVVQGLPWWLSW